MVTTIVLLFCFSLAFLAGGFVAFKGVHLGLRWQFQAKQEQPPTLDNPIQPILDKVKLKQQEKQEAEIKSVFSEWTNGADER